MVVIASTRPGRVGPAVARWFVNEVERHAGFNVDVADLAALALPMMDEPKHPRLQQYTHEHTRAWSARVDAADAFVFVAPEYNHGMIAPLKNALDYLYLEWHGKPASFVSYGGVSGGVRAAQAAKPVLTALKMMPVPEAVVVPFVARHIDERGEFVAAPEHAAGAKAMLDELRRWASALRPLRAMDAAAD